jgi:thiol-disulfide isomerase/thioredoxin
MSRITAAGPPAKRPPHSALDWSLPVVIGRILLSLAVAAATLATSGNAALSQPHKLGQIDRSHAGEPAPAIGLEAQDGRKTTVAALVAAAHRPVLVNLWATWCVPCRAELPALDALAKARPGLLVLPVSEDLEGWRGVAKVFVPGKFPSLTTWVDQPGNYAVKLGVAGLPVSILYGADGREKWRVNGPLKWGSPEVAAALAA